TAGLVTRPTIVAVTARTVLARATVVAAGAAVTTIATIAVVTALHHCGCAFFVFFNTNGHEAEHVLRQTHLAFHFLHGRGRSVEVHEGEISLAVFLHAVGQGLQSPVLNPADLAAILFDNALVLFNERIDLLRRDVLPSKNHMFIKSQCSLPFFSFASVRPRR